LQTWIKAGAYEGCKQAFPEQEDKKPADKRHMATPPAARCDGAFAKTPENT